ncbi:hypothetical protein DESA109040_21650 [Deinococcus saxicola]|uniref:DUF6624 domain-containing protein n=1 Tax=Deinococcus saxicola TaxID=249406 RepID=UPI0039EE1F33
MSAGLRRWLTVRMEADTRMRRGPVNAAAWLAFDTESTELLRKIVAAYGWPSRSLVGEDGATAAWLLAQHSPDLGFQREVLALLNAAQETDPRHAAYLHDRVRVREGRPQRYGTQLGPDAQPFELEVGDVDERRAAVGLGPLAKYLAQFTPT